MKPVLPEDRAARAVPSPLSPVPSPLARAGAWARESLAARVLAIGGGLVLLALLGGSALARGVSPSTATAAPAPSAVAPSPAPPPTELAAASADAGVSIPVTEPALLPRAPATEPAPRARASPDDPVDLNAAHVDDLRRLPGVGAKRAEAILAARARMPGGRFQQIEDLLRVKGVGRAMLKRIGPLVKIGGGPRGP